MPFATLHDFFENRCPQGVGLALRIGHLENQAVLVVQYLSVLHPHINEDVVLPQFPQIGFSFKVDPTSFKFRSSGLISLSVSVWLHPRGYPNQPIVTQTLSLVDSPIKVGTDPISGDLAWIPRVIISPAITNVVQGADANLIAAGYAKSSGVADWDKFNKDVYYGFIWQTAGNFFSGIIANMPFPQIQKWIRTFKLNSPIKADFHDDYLAIWSDRVSIDPINCGPTLPPPNNNPTLTWRSGAVPPGPLSHSDAQSPSLLLYMSAQPLLSWKAAAFMPGVVFQQSGGGFVRWGINAAVGLQSLDIVLHPSSTGGTITVDGMLVFFGDASAWIDGPSGTRVASITETVQGDATVNAQATINFQKSILSVDLDTLVNVAVVRSSVVFGGGLSLPWPIGVVVDDILDILVRSGAIEIPPLYNASTHSDILSLSKFLQYGGMTAAITQRVGARSVLLGVDEIKEERRSA